MKHNHHVIPGLTWGTLPKAHWPKWKSDHCDKVIEQHFVPKDLPESDEDKSKFCLENGKKYNVEGMNLRNLPHDLKSTWRYLHCSMMIWDQKYSQVFLCVFDL